MNRKLIFLLLLCAMSAMVGKKNDIIYNFVLSILIYNI